MAKQCCSALILAAGKGTRMKSACPKVMQPLLEEPMLYYVIEALKKAGINDIAVVVGHGGDQVQSWLAVHEPDVKSIWQHEQLGTGHAVLSAADWIRTRQRILVVNGDMPMLTEKEVIEFLDTSANADIAFMTCDLEDPAQYGR
ncbi:MAG: NTP transferase domain-containing protein, partial [Synergistaceae bacterium]|nr:NTP transferase domain-containing protein [Synergistaceae bacterium]